MMQPAVVCIHPASHVLRVQAAAPALKEYSPFSMSQRVHVAACIGAYCPGAQAEHALFHVGIVPAAQWLMLHWFCPDAIWYLPDGHVSHSCACSSRCSGVAIRERRERRERRAADPKG